MNSYESLTSKAEKFLAQHPKVDLITAEKFVMEPPDLVVVRSAKTKLEHDYLKVNATTPEAESEFDWKIELTNSSNHYLLLKDGRIVRAVRKDFFDATSAEIQGLEQQLDLALSLFDSWTDKLLIDQVRGKIS